MRRLIVLVVLALGLASTAAAATPKPWFWTPAQTARTIVAQKPALNKIDGVAATLTGAKCRGIGKARQGKFTAFRCASSFRSLSGDTAVGSVWARIRPVGKGLPCMSLEKLSAIPRACLATSGPPRVVGDAVAAASALREWLPTKFGGPRLAQGTFDCLGFGAGYYECSFTSTRNGTSTVLLTTRGPRFTVAWSS